MRKTHSVESILEIIRDYQGDVVVELDNPMGYYKDGGYFDDHSIKEIITDFNILFKISIEKDPTEIEEMSVKNFIEYVILLLESDEG